ncbi:hypothetical protein D4R75_14985 [bacterium]|nr:MAG: hypothetical protein D4R75_14985 [bacterium]
MLNGVGVFLALMFLGGVSGGGWLLSLGLFALFLGMTDFGRQCPLILSARHLAYRMRSLGKSPVLSAKPIKETSESDVKNIPS